MPVRAPKRRSPTSRLSFFDSLERRVLFAFGVTTTSTTYVVDTGAGLTFTILRGGTTSSTIHLGDMTSVKYNGTEMLATYSVTSRYSHYEQGLSSASIITATVDPSATPQWIMVTVDDSANTSMPVIHNYIAKRGEANIYMTSLPIDVNVGPGEGRYIAYLDRNIFSNPEAPSDNAGNTGSIEGSDVFGHADGTTTSKFYNMGRRMIDNTVHGVVGTTSGGATVGAYMWMGNREHSAGGPFFKDIDFQSGSAVEIYNCIFTGHTQTETYRQGIHTYAMSFTNGSAPATPNYAFLEGLNIQGLVPASGRGSISGVASGVPVGHEAVVALSNSTEQYWTKANADGTYSITGVMPGTYTETLYDREIAVGTRTVTVTAGSNTKAPIASTYYTPAATWRIGTWDGTPQGFLNADKIEIMHPSDSRMSSWVLPADATTGMPTFTVGTDSDSAWPMVQFMGVNNSNRIAFTLTSAQAAVAQTLRIGITLGFEGGRNRVTVNSGNTGVTAWTSSIPTASQDLNSRGITRGTYRGTNQLYTYSIPTTALKAGLNWIDLPVVSGSYVAGQTWLSPNVAYDAIDLVPTSSVAAPAVSSIAITPAVSTLAANGTTTFAATAKSSSGATLAANIVWTAARGLINDNGEYVAPSTPGADTITATYNGVSSTATVLVLANTAQRLWYKANETAGSSLIDSTGNNLTATLSGAYAYGTGVEGSAVQFTGGSAKLPNAITTGLNDFTIGFWVKPDASQSWARVFDFGSSTTSYMFFSPRTNTGVSRFAINTGSGEQTVSGAALAVGAWSHVVITLNGNTATLYINGQVAGTNTAMTYRPSALGNTTNNLIGDSQFTADPNLLGTVDDLRLYSAAITASDVTAWRNSALPTVTSFAVDNGTQQRSMVRSLTINFDKAVDLGSGALSLLLNGNASPVTLTATPTSTEKTEYVVTFSGTGVSAASLADGRYQLVVNAAAVTTAAGLSMNGSTSYSFFRLFGDNDGSATVNFNDFLALQTAFGLTSGSAGYLSGFDSDNNGVIDFNDFLLLQANFGKTI
ncbi:MAG: rhamnogalacturonan lyase B N-terminal domain-containing protein [Tepidisphaeraceae bacterium]